MQNLVNNNQEKENDLIKSLKNNIENLKNSIEIKENTIQTIQKSHKILQDKFLKLCSDKRKKEQEDLLIQAKEMKIKKIKFKENKIQKIQKSHKILIRFIINSSESEIPIKSFSSFEIISIKYSISCFNFPSITLSTPSFKISKASFLLFKLL